jgi:hypothetical protein
MALTMIISILGLGIVIVEVHYGAGQHRDDLAEETYHKGMKLNFISQPVYLYALCLVKVAIGASLLRIARTKFYRRLIISIMVFLLLYTFACVFVSLSLPYDSHILLLY